jgi:hypothetical protein
VRTERSCKPLGNRIQTTATCIESVEQRGAHTNQPPDLGRLTGVLAGLRKTSSRIPAVDRLSALQRPHQRSWNTTRQTDYQSGAPGSN